MKELHHDFCAVVDGNITIARIFQNKIANNESVWSANMLVGFGGGASVLTRREAILWVEDQFIRFVETHPDDDPQEWVPDQRSMELQYLRERDPAAYAEMVAALKSGKIDRVPRKS